MNVEKGVPIPPKGNTRARSEMSKAVISMGINDSFVVRTPEEATSALCAFRYYGRKGTYRKTETGWRVWRIE